MVNPSTSSRLGGISSKETHRLPFFSILVCDVLGSITQFGIWKWTRFQNYTPSHLWQYPRYSSVCQWHTDSLQRVWGTNFSFKIRLLFFRDHNREEFLNWFGSNRIKLPLIFEVIGMFNLIPSHEVPWITTSPQQVKEFRLLVYYFAKIDKKVKAWKGKMLSIGGRLIPVNSVLSSVPTYWWLRSSSHSKSFTEWTEKEENSSI